MTGRVNGSLQAVPRRGLLLAGAGWLAGCGGGAEGGGDAPPPPPSLQVQIEGLAGRKVVRLRESAVGLLAVTDAGLFVRRDDAWQALGLAGRDLVDALSLDGNRLLASSRLEGMFVSDDAGRTWRALISNFGGSFGPETAWALLAAGPRLFATHAGGFAVSADGGHSWALRVGNWGSVSTGMSALALGSQGEVWFGGQNAIEEPVLGRWRDSGLDEWARLMPSPSTVKSVRLIASQPQRALVCGEGGILQTLDEGRNWTRLFIHPDHHFLFDVLADPLRPRRWVSASYRKSTEPQRLSVVVSDDDGVNWRKIEHPDDRLFGGVLSLHVAVEAGRTVYRFGLSQDGVARVLLPL